MNDVDALSLKARLLKDQAFSSGAKLDRDKVLEACGLYAAVYRRTRSSYPAINAATLAKIAGRTQLAAGLAREVVRQVSAEGRQDYFSLATLAEALVVLGDLTEAEATLAKAVQAPDADVGSRSTTFLQLQRLVNAAAPQAGSLTLLEPIRPPKVAMFCGNIFVGGDRALEAKLADEMRDIIVREKVGFGYGALAAGSDIIIAEQLLDAGAELHVVMPFAEADFLAQSVKPSGESWVRRYNDCKMLATTVTFASNMSYVGEQAQFAYGSKVTMGMARLRARHLNGEAIQLAIVKGAGAGTLSGSDIAAWRAVGAKSEVVTTPELKRPVLPPPPPRSHVKRGTYGIMFTDFPGFTGLDERVLPIFWQEVMLRAASVLERYADVIRESNTWGDALYVVFQDARPGNGSACRVDKSGAGGNAHRPSLRHHLFRLRPDQPAHHLLRHRGQPRGAHRAGDALRQRLCHRAVRRGAGDGEGPPLQLQLRGQDGAGEGLRHLPAVPPAPRHDGRTVGLEPTGTGPSGPPASAAPGRRRARRTFLRWSW